jgi:hypothetical protein
MNDLPETLASAESCLPRTRSEAVAMRSTLYSNGEACPAGHNGARYTRNGYCVACQREATRANRVAVSQALSGAR